MKTRIVLIALIASLIFIFFYLELNQYVNLDYFKTQQNNIAEYKHAHPLKTTLIFFCTYIVITALSIPGAAIMTLASGAIFGLTQGILLASFASTIGATLAFLTSRFLCQDILQKKMSNKLHTINQGMEKDGALYLFALRLVPIFPFFLVNLLMGLMPIKTLTFFITSQLGMLAGTMVYVYAGTQLATIRSLEDILSIELIISFALIGLLPIVAKKTIHLIQSKRHIIKMQDRKKQDSS